MERYWENGSGYYDPTAKRTIQTIEKENKARYEAIGYTVEAFQKVMQNDFGFGAVRMGRVAEGIYRELGIDPEEV